ncbi:MAG: serine hydrolase domain-containing protein [Cyclobacteriaceae bacterium]
MKKTLLVAVAIFFTAQACQKKVDREAPLSLTNYFKASTLPAAVMVYTTGNGYTKWYAFGPSTWGNTDTVTEDHIFRIFSMTKAISSVAALQLVEKGLIGLNDPLNELMPEMASIPILTEDGKLVKSDQLITLRHLLTHTSGFAYITTSARLNNFKPESWKYEDKPRVFEPGAQWKYGTSTDWVGKIIEKFSGQDLEAYFRENITGPLHMNRTWFNVPDSLEDMIVSWGARDSTGFRESSRVRQQPVTYFSGGGGLFGSPKDYLTFLECLLNGGKYSGGQLLKSETVEMMFKNHLPDKMSIDYELPGDTLPGNAGGYLDESDKFGLAWAIEDNDDEKIRPKGTAYWAGAANSYYSVDNKNGVAIVYFNQFFPFNDKEAFDFYRLFEKEVYSRIQTD